MATTCPKCNYTRTPADTGPDYECPRCGVIYAKAKLEAATQDQSTPHGEQATSPPTADTRVPVIDASKRLKQLLALAFAAGLILGYFLGREHIKYELRSVFQDAAAGISKGLGAAFGTGSSKAPEQRKQPPKGKQTFPITATLTKKGWYGGEYGRNAITFTVSFANAAGKDVRAFDGSLVFTDLLGNEILGAKLAVNDPVSSGQSLEWEGKLDYNQFISSHERLRNAEVQNTKVNFVLRRILFADGEVKEYAQ